MRWCGALLVVAMITIPAASADAKKRRYVRIDKVAGKHTVHGSLKIVAIPRGKPRKVSFTVDRHRRSVSSKAPYRLGGLSGRLKTWRLKRGKHKIIVRAYYGPGLRRRAVATVALRVHRYRSKRDGKVVTKVITSLPSARKAVPVATPPAPAPAPVATAAAAPAPTRLTGWLGLSGVYTGAGNVAGAQQFGTQRGRPVDIVADFTDQTSGDIANPHVLGRYKDTGWKVSLAMWPWPAGGSDARAANGEYVGLWRQTGNAFKVFGDDRIAVRPGWELNGLWFEWGRDPAAFVKWWKLMHDTISPIAPRTLWDFNTVIGKADFTRYYPGDQYVDIISIDPYDTVGALSNVKAGLDTLGAFARAHGKRVAFPEWALSDTDHYGQGDNPAYIQLVYDWIQANKDIVAFEAYFEYDAPDGAHELLGTFPISGARYRSLW